MSCATRRQRRLRGVQPEPEVLVRERGVQVGRLVPVRIPAAADLHAALVLAQADRGHVVHERRGVGVGHVRADLRGIVGGIGLVGRVEEPRQLLRLGRQTRVALELDVDVGLGPLIGAEGAVGARHAVIEQHHVVLDHPEPLRFRVASRAGRIFFPLQALPLRDVGARAVEARFFVVPEREPDRAIGQHVAHREDPRQLHHQRRARAVVVGRLAPANPVHVRADDVHLAGTRGADLGAVDLFTGPVFGRLAVQRAQPRVGLAHGVVVHAGPHALPARTAAAGGARVWVRRATSPRLRIRRRRLELVPEAPGRAAVALELRLDPVDGPAIPLGALAPVAELRQSLDRGLVALEIEPRHERPDGIGRRGHRRCRRLRTRRRRDRHGEHRTNEPI